MNVGGSAIVMAWSVMAPGTKEHASGLSEELQPEDFREAAAERTLSFRGAGELDLALRVGEADLRSGLRSLNRGNARDFGRSFSSFFMICE